MGGGVPIVISKSHNLHYPILGSESHYMRYRSQHKAHAFDLFNFLCATRCLLSFQGALVSTLVIYLDNILGL